MDRLQTEGLEEISKTMLITLYMRYLESKRESGLITNDLYSDIVTKLNYDFSGFESDDELELFIASRTLIFDNAVRNFIKKNENCTIVNLACGLDIRFFVVDNGEIQWFDVDLPEVIKIRKKLFGKQDRLGFIESSVLDYSWILSIPKNRKVLFVIEGLLLYLSGEEVKTLFINLLNNFNNVEIVFDVVSSFYLDYLRKNRMPKYLDWDKTPFKWGINTYAEIEKFHERIKFLEEWYLSDYFKERCPDSIKQLLLANPLAKNMNKVMHFSL